MKRCHGSIVCLLLSAVVSCAEGPTIVEGGTWNSGEAAGKSDGVRGIYPLPLEVHLSDAALAPLVPGAVHAELPNAVAYARHGLQLVQWQHFSGSPETVAAEVARGWARVAAQSQVPAQDAVRYANAVATEAESAQLLEELFHDAQHVSGEPRLSKVQQRLADVRAGLDLCSAEGIPAADCCTVLGYFAALSRAEERASWSEADLQLGFYSAWVDSRLAEEEAALQAGNKVTIQPFVQLGVKAWMAECAPILQHTPRDLDELKWAYGEWTQDPAWAVELHPVSIAKLAGRRIYRRTLPDGTRISVADSLGADCGVRETEIIVAPAVGPTQFLSYGPSGQRTPHGYFPSAVGSEQVKLTPDSCMGCHYTFDQREFTVVAPSFEALSLKLPVRDGVPQWRDDSACQQPRDTLVWHDAPIRSF